MVIYKQSLRHNKYGVQVMVSPGHVVICGLKFSSFWSFYIYASFLVATLFFLTNRGVFFIL